MVCCQLETKGESQAAKRVLAQHREHNNTPNNADRTDKFHPLQSGTQEAVALLTTTDAAAAPAAWRQSRTLCTATAAMICVYLCGALERLVALWIERANNKTTAIGCLSCPLSCSYGRSWALFIQLILPHNPVKAIGAAWRNASARVACAAVQLRPSPLSNVPVTCTKDLSIVHCVQHRLPS